MRLKVKPYNAAIACYHLAYTGNIYITPKDLNGNDLTLTSEKTYGARLSDLIPTATADTLDTFHRDDYQIEEVIPIGFTRTLTLNNGIKNAQYTITIENTTTNIVNISCFKFKKALISGTESLMYGYFLVDDNGNQTSISVSPGQTKKYSVDISI